VWFISSYDLNKRSMVCGLYYGLCFSTWFVDCVNYKKAYMSTQRQLSAHSNRQACMSTHQTSTQCWMGRHFCEHLHSSAAPRTRAEMPRRRLAVNAHLCLTHTYLLAWPDLHKYYLTKHIPCMYSHGLLICPFPQHFPIFLRFTV
jgi:hypothetical protein